MLNESGGNLGELKVWDKQVQQQLYGQMRDYGLQQQMERQFLRQISKQLKQPQGSSQRSESI